MSILVYLIAVSLALGAGALAVFLWTLANGQYDDLDGAARRVLYDDAGPIPPAAPQPQPEGPASART